MIISLALDNYCTHGCWYCCDNTTNKKHQDAYIDLVGVDKYLRMVLELANGNIVNYRINGGEPFENSYIKEVTTGILEKGHNITFLTNLTHIDNVVDACIKEQVQMEASFHLSRYSESQINNYKKYFYVATTISNKISVVIVLTPEVINNEKLNGYVNWFKQTGENNNCEVDFIYQELYNDKYPSAYTQDEKDKILEIGNTEIDNLIKINRVLYLKGMNCTYMVENIDVHRNGTISRCSAGFPGLREHLINSKLKVTKGYAPCSYEKCLCIPRGIKGCLDQNGISLTKYLKNRL